MAFFGSGMVKIENDPISANKKPFKQKMLEGLHPVFLTLGLLLPIPMPADNQQHAKAGLLASPSF